MSSFEHQPYNYQHSWAERNGFAHWAIVMIWLVVAFISFQATAALVFTGLMFLTGAFSEISDAADLLTSRMDLLFIGNSTGQILFIGLATFVVTRLHTIGEGVKEYLRIRWHTDTLKYLMLGGLLILAAQPAVMYLGYLNSLLPVPEFFTNLQTDQYQMIQNFLTTEGVLLFALFNIAVVPALCEEVLFRGYVMRSFEKSWGIITAIIVSSIIFGLFHIQLGNLLPLATLGAILALMTWLSGSLWPAIIAHFLNNGAAVVAGINFPELMFREMNAEALPPIWLLLVSIFISGLLVAVMFRQSNFNGNPTS
ncbi:MAG: CPBP family intramembrane metalloprotease [Balneolaceae bacterium]|nr:MAG: CPBP family intramembrane metalloprotease [Balneolaceae bacterium]